MGVATGGTPAGMGPFSLGCIVVHIWVVKERKTRWSQDSRRPCSAPKTEVQGQPSSHRDGPWRRGAGAQASLALPPASHPPGLAPFFPKLLSEKPRLALHNSERLQSIALSPEITQGGSRGLVPLQKLQGCRSPGSRAKGRLAGTSSQPGAHMCT